jgi:hypothetical protein
MFGLDYLAALHIIPADFPFLLQPISQYIHFEYLMNIADLFHIVRIWTARGAGYREIESSAKGSVRCRFRAPYDPDPLKVLSNAN